MVSKKIPVALLLALLAGGVLILLNRPGPPETSGGGRRRVSAADPDRSMPSRLEGPASPAGSPGTTAGESTRPDPAVALPPSPGGDRRSIPAGRRGGLTWPRPAPPGARAGTAASAGGEGGEPAVPIKLAFRALWYLGTDPAAERTWLRAINDPNTPPGVRSDLIEDMEDEGYSDNSRPTKKDLPIILARLDLIERYAPYAMDEVNARAFEIAYRRLLDLYVRLGGKPREEER